MGHHIAPKPYKIVDKTEHKTILKDKLEEDNYVIVSFSNSLSKIGFDYKDKFIFVERIEGVSGTLIRESIQKDNFDGVLDMMPSKTIPFSIKTSVMPQVNIPRIAPPSRIIPFMLSIISTGAFNIQVLQ